MKKKLSFTASENIVWFRHSENSVDDFVLIVALSTIARIWTHPKYPTEGERSSVLNEQMNGMQLYKKMNACSLQNLEISLKENKYQMILFICGNTKINKGLDN